MGDKSKIEWTEATWNPTTGCTKVSTGCTNCYAERLSLQLHDRGIKKYRNKFELTLHPDTLEIPLKWKTPKRIFVNSMSDLFHAGIPLDYIDRVFNIMEKAHWHQFQILTKRPQRMHEYINGDWGHTLDNVWLGTSIENESWKSRIDYLRATDAKIRFLSCEPLLGPLPNMNLFGIHWVIVGGESGPGHRPIKAEWVREIRDQCIDQEVPFFFKQWGGPTPKSGGRELDGKIYSEYPTEPGRRT